MATLSRIGGRHICVGCDGIIVLGAALLVGLLIGITPPAEWFPQPVATILVFALLTELLPVPLLRGGVQVTLGFPIVCTVIALYGTVPAIAVDSLPTLLAGLLLNRSRPLPYRLRWSVFNASQSAISAGTAGIVFHWLLQMGRSQSFGWTAACIMVAAIVYLMVNALLVSRVEAVYQNKPLVRVLGYNLRVVLPTYVMAMPLVMGLILLLKTYGVLGFTLVAVPFFAARESFRQRIQQLRNYREALRVIGMLVQRADPYTSGHMRRAAQMVEQLATRLGVPTQHVELLLDAVALHDLGKVVVDEAVLNKIAPLTEEEWAMIREHPVRGAAVLNELRHMSPVGLWIMLHHERPDGKGYPFGLKIGEIPIESHIIAVLDAFDAMVGDEQHGEVRPYRKPKTPEQAIDELRRCAGTQFHPAVVEAFVEVYTRYQQDVGSVSPSTLTEKRAVA